MKESPLFCQYISRAFRSGDQIRLVQPGFIESDFVKRTVLLFGKRCILSFSTVVSAATEGLAVEFVHVEADVSDGLPSFTMVGFPSAQVKEAQDRVRTALKNMGISLPPKRITINLSPADVRKEGSRFDLPIAAGVLMTLGRIPPGSLRKTMVLGELGLDGHVQEISGVFPAAAKARELGCTTLLVPAGNAAEGGLVGGLHVVGIQNLQELLNYCCEGKMPSLPSIENQKKEDGKEPDFSEVQGQTAARRAALIAAAGFHNLLMLGPPGSGKSMIARRIPTIMPPMSEEEQMEVTRIYSIAGMLAKGEGVRRERPFRAPHHTMSPQALAGGGKQPSPGEITLAHRGVLFLDELPEMTRTTIEILRQPLEEHRIVISRVSGNYVFPASFLMVAAMNPCPCGFYPDLSRCTCAPGDISRYLSRVSQPFLDRMDLCVQVEALSYEDLHGEERCESSARMREKATAAAEIQAARYRQESIHFNSELKAGQIEKYCILEKAAEELLEDAFRRLRLSARSYHGIIRTARTIADLDGAVKIGVPHISEAICFRSADKSIWRI